ncbi:MAG: pectin methylesterase [Oscillospiraceae bacterium]|nr:pectin methylesterase [Oscillospiraceae bacterium]
MITVGTNGDFSSVNDAVQAAKSGDTIFVSNSIYHERVEVTTPNITLIGEDKNNTVIEYGLYARKIVDGEKLGTFRSYTMLVNADSFTCKNITIANTAGFGDDVGQAIAVYAEGDSISFEDCRFLGHQDTLFTGPLPFREIEKGGFRGPTEFAERRVVHQTYKRCYIEGEVDFIFGSASAYFEECELFSINCGKEINGFVTAASTYNGADYGHIFNRCRFVSDCPDNTVYLGRPWRNFAQTVLIECEIGEHIHEDLFHDWNKADARDTVFYGVYSCRGKEISGAAPFVKMLTKDEAEELLKKIKTAP